MASSDKIRVMCGIEDALNKAKKTGVLDLQNIYYYNSVFELIEISKRDNDFTTYVNDLRDTLNIITYGDNITNLGDTIIVIADDVVPNDGSDPNNDVGTTDTGSTNDNNGQGDSSSTDDTDGNGNSDSQDFDEDTGGSGQTPEGGDNGSGGSPTITAPTISALTVSTSKGTPISGSMTIYDVYTFSKADFLGIYSDNNDQDFYQLVLDTTTLDNGFLLYNGVAVAEGSGNLTVLASDLGNLVWYTNTNVEYTHDLSFNLADKVGNTITLAAANATLTISRILAGVNQPPTMGDQALYVNNRTTTIITLAMVTSSLTPPYNDPEGDLIDAIRIDEVSTANTGEFQFNGSPVTANLIITREQLESNLFTHVGPNTDSITTDSINISARDEGSGVWVS